MQTEDPNAVIGQCAEDGSSSLCFETMKVFTAAYGAEAGNIALKVLATGGMYLGGGIAPKILKTLKNGAFIQAFLDKKGACRRCWNRFLSASFSTTPAHCLERLPTRKRERRRSQATLNALPLFRVDDSNASWPGV